MNSKNRFILNNLLASEFFLLNVVLIIFIYFNHGSSTLKDVDFLADTLVLIFIHNLSWLFIIVFIRENEFYFNKNHNYLKSLLLSLFFFIGLIMFQVWLFKLKNFSPSTYLYPILIFSYLNFLSHKYILNRLKSNGSSFLSRALLVSSGYEAQEFKEFANVMAQYGHNVIAYLDKKHGAIDNLGELVIKGSVFDLPNVLSENEIDEIFVDMSVLEREQIKNIVRIADNHGVRVRLMPEKPLKIASHYEADAMGNLAVFKLHQSPLDIFTNNLVKQLFDYSFALLAVILLAPAYLIISVLIILDSKGPILYSPYRKGEAGKTFKCYKFRTMSTCDNPINGTKSTVANDPRITRVGKILRKLDFDELPQFFNVLKGEMSVIGPRPHRINLQNDFRKSVSDYMVRSYVKPGITGWAQVNGWRGPTDTEEQKNERVKHDIWYVENWSFWLDIKIIFLTIFGKQRSRKILVKIIRIFF